MSKNNRVNGLMRTRRNSLRCFRTSELLIAAVNSSSILDGHNVGSLVSSRYYGGIAKLEGKHGGKKLLTNSVKRFSPHSSQNSQWKIMGMLYGERNIEQFIRSGENHEVFIFNVLNAAKDFIREDVTSAVYQAQNSFAKGEYMVAFELLIASIFYTQNVFLKAAEALSPGIVTDNLHYREKTNLAELIHGFVNTHMQELHLSEIRMKEFVTHLTRKIVVLEQEINYIINRALLDKEEFPMAINIDHFTK